jgi:uncharacterized protein
MLIIIGVYILSALVLTFLGLEAASLLTQLPYESIRQSLEGNGSTDESTILGVKVVQFFYLLSFPVAAVVLTQLLFRTDPAKFTGVGKRPRLALYLLAAIAFVALSPLVDLSIMVNQRLDLPASLQPLEDAMRTMEDRAAEMTATFLKMDSISDLLGVIFIMALVPAICEEFFFRGFLQRTFYRWWGRRHLAVILSAFLFSAIHFQFFGFLPRFLLGLLLGYVFLWSGDLKLSIFIHFLNNLASTLYAWAYRDQLQVVDINAPMANYPPVYFFLSAIGGGLFMYMFYRQTRLKPDKPDAEDVVYRLPVEDVPWEKVYSTSRQYEAEIIAGKLEDAGIKAVIVNKQDSSYRAFGEVEIHVPRTFVSRAKEILG